MIFLVLCGGTIEENEDLLADNRAQIQGAELRSDHLRQPDPVRAAALAGRAGVPLILSCRRPADGGRWRGSEAERLAFMEAAVRQGAFAFADLEDDLVDTALEGACRSRGTRVIRSFYNFSGVPDDLEARLRKNRRRPDDLPKAAVMPKTSADLERLLEVFRRLAGFEKILLGMGAYGFPTRPLAPVLGSLLAFASPPGAEAASGHIDPAMLAGVYRYDRLGPATRLFGIVGNPISHSKSPPIHNAGYDALGLDAVYVPFLADRLETFLRSAEALGLRGVSITLPFKEQILPFLAEADETVRAVGSCNTILRGQGGWRGTNTDAAGFMAPLFDLYGAEGLKGLDCMVVGAGGAARAAVYGLARAGSRVLILNRSPERAERLARDIEASLGLARGSLSSAGRDKTGVQKAGAWRGLVVQTTPAGMSPNAGEDAFPEYDFSGRETAYDLVYNPRETIFLRRAAAAGCRVISGERMLLEQAYLQFKLYTGCEYPREKLEARIQGMLSQR